MSAYDRTFSVHAAFIRGVEAVPVTVEVSMGGGIPGISFVGMADGAVVESRVRIRCALRACGFEIPRRSIVVNLSPGDLKKSGTGFDLPIAVAILALSGQIPTDDLDDKLFVGELTLDGDILPSKGEVAYGILARDANLELVTGRTDQHVSLEGVRHRILDSIAGVGRGLDGFLREWHVSSPSEMLAYDGLDYSDVLGQEACKRALVVAACGGLGMLMVGPPGSGKTMLARRMGTILPGLDPADLQDALRIHSVLGEDLSRLVAGERPFRSPHHTISTAGLIGGGRPVHPGEISLAHGGVLFLDELAEFPSSVLQTLRQPLEEGRVRVVRVDGSYSFPASFQLLAASNPCPCGYLGDGSVECRCQPSQVVRYQSKLGGPLADRIDITVDVARPAPDAIVEGCEGKSSREMREEVIRGREFRAWRLHSLKNDAPQLQKRGEGAIAKLSFASDAEEALMEAARRHNLTGRGIRRVARVARTIADLDESALVTRVHMIEAMLYRGRSNDGS